MFVEVIVDFIGSTELFELGMRKGSAVLCDKVRFKVRFQGGKYHKCGRVFESTEVYLDIYWYGFEDHGS